MIDSILVNPFRIPGEQKVIQSIVDLIPSEQKVIDYIVDPVPGVLLVIPWEYLLGTWCSPNDSRCVVPYEVPMIPEESLLTLPISPGFAWLSFGDGHGARLL